MNTCNPELFNALQYRLIGPFRAGRVVAVAGHPTEAQTFYFGSTGGGVWKTEDGGQTWRNVSDGFFNAASVGAIAVSQADPNVIYAGMGEATIRGNVAHGDGVYKSADGGSSWRHVGLSDSRHIGKIRIHPTNPDVAYVAALGHVFGPGGERGVFRTADGGKTWQQVLGRSERAGAVDLSLDPHNPRILYAAFWDVRRTPYSLDSGGPDSSLYKSVDGGDTWVEITENPGLPKALRGKLGIAASPAKPGRVFAIIEAAEGSGLYRSEDYGATWTLVHDKGEIRQRPWYYQHIIPDPQDPETVYILNVQFWRSVDGGRTFTSVGTPHNDNHDLWIDPRNPRRMITGNDGGACVSFTGGGTWSTVYNQPTGEFYHVTTDNRWPYRLYGSQQDNSSISVPSRTERGLIGAGDWYAVGGGESGYIAVRPDDPDIVFAGSYGGLITRYDHRTGRTRNISVWPENALGSSASDLRYRFQWTFPIVLSPHDPNVLYAAGNCLFRSTDEGHSWEQVSPDLTRNDPSKLGPSGGPITKDQVGTEYYCTIFAFAESPVQPGVLWAGSDDGLIHVSRDNGETWTNVTPPSGLLPEWALISIIEPGQHAAGTAFVAANRYKLDDNQPYLLKTIDFGKTWTRIDEGIAKGHFTRVIRQDPVQADLLYAGTERGVYVSVDGGASWQELRLNLPVVPVHDLQIKTEDLVVATHGRSFWILDNAALLRQLTPAVAEGGVHLFAPPPAYRLPGASLRYHKDESARAYLRSGVLVVTGETKPDDTLHVFDAAQNAPVGVHVAYWLKTRPEGEVKLGFYDSNGALIRQFSSNQPDASSTGDHQKKEPVVPVEPGGNRFIWNMRYPDASDVPGNIMDGGSVTGPVALPGAYTVRLTVGGHTYTQSFEIRKDPRLSDVTLDDLQAQFDLLIQVRDRLTEAHNAVNQIRDLKAQVQGWVKRAGDNGAVAKAAEALTARLTAIEETLWQPKFKVGEDVLDLPMQLNNKLASVGAVAAEDDCRPNRQTYAVFADVTGRIDARLAELKAVLAEDVAAFTGLLRDARVPLVSVSRA